MTDHQIFNSLIEFFEEDNWDFQWVAGASALSMGFSGVNGKWLCYAQARETEEQFVFYSVLSVNVPPKKRHKVAEFITRVNYGLVIGNFEMDYDDGEIRYKTSVDIEGSTLHASMIKQMVYANLIITDRYLPGVMRVIYSDEHPIDILDTIELDQDYEDTFENDAFLIFDDDEDDLEAFDDNDEDDFSDFDHPTSYDGGSPN
ncbi:MAG: YbjN domain-containing protein [Chloroflexota bacterium]